ncbi:TPA: O-antigen polymerase [Photobacterium damselae]
MRPAIILSLLFIVLNSILFFVFDKEILNFIICVNFIFYIYVIYKAYVLKYTIYFDFYFIVLFPFYYLIQYYLYFYWDIRAFHFSDVLVYKSVILCNITWFIVLVLMVVRPKGYSSYSINNKFNIKYNELKNKKLSLSLFCIGLFVSIIFYKESGGGDFSNILNQNRLELIGATNQRFWYLKYIIISYSCYILSIISSNFKKKSSYIYLVPVIIYSLSLLLSGSRRELLLIVMFSVMFYFVKNKERIRVRHISNLAVFLFVFISMGALRNINNGDANTIIMNALGEFIYPISTYTYYFCHGVNEYLYGSGYFQFISNFIPKYIWLDKPLPVAVEFAKLVSMPEQKFIMGYASTPMTEAFLNFGFFSFLFFPLLFSIVIYLIEYLFRNRVLIIILFLSQCVNFQRSDIASQLFELVLLISCFYFCELLTKKGRG